MTSSSRPLRAPRFLSLPLLTLLVLGLMAAPTAAQESALLSHTQFGVGFVGNAPDAIVGGGAYVIFPKFGGIGLYVDAKFDPSNPTGERGWDASVTSAEVANDIGGDYIKTEASWQSFNVALVRPFSPTIIAYAGAGVAKSTSYDLYNVALDSGVGYGGVVWAEDTEREETKVNVLFGVITRISRRISAHFGYDTQPSGLTVGFSLRMPAW